MSGIYEVRGIYPDMTLEFFALKKDAVKLAKVNPEQRAVTTISYTSTKEGIVILLNRMFDHLDDGVAGPIKPEGVEDVTPAAMKVKISALRNAVRMALDMGDCMDDDEINALLAL